MNRLDSLRRRLKRLKTDAFLCTGRTNLRYLTAFTGSNGAALVSAEHAWFFTDFRYKTQSAEQVKGFQIVVPPPAKDLFKAAARVAKQNEFGSLAVDANSLTVAQFEDAQQTFQGIDLISTREVIESQRMVKDASELAAIRKATAIADAAYDFILARIRPGRTEVQIARELEAQMLKLGADGLAFEPIVISGARTALPHGRPSTKRFERGDLVTLDFGALFGGYRSDCTRTICVGKPTSEQQRIYRLVRDAHFAAKEHIRSGGGCRAIDKVARDLITTAGYGNQFGHGLGHGVGLDIHEGPRFSKLGKGKLAAGNVMTVEPGIYLEGWGGVRIEDLLVVTDHGFELLTTAPNPARIPVV